MIGIRRDVRPGVALEDFLAGAAPAVEHAATVLEFSVDGVFHDAVAAARELLAPLAGLRVIEEKCQSLKVAPRPGSLDLLQVGAPVPQRLVDYRPGHFFPLVLRNAAQDVCPPGAKVKIEGMLLLRRLCGARGQRRLSFEHRGAGQQAQGGGQRAAEALSPGHVILRLQWLYRYRAGPRI